MFVHGYQASKLTALFFGILLAAGTAISFYSSTAHAQQSDSAAGPVVVQPGAPGKPTKRLPASTKGTLPPPSPADVDFMQGMIMHHSRRWR